MTVARLLACAGIVPVSWQPHLAPGALSHVNRRTFLAAAAGALALPLTAGSAQAAGFAASTVLVGAEKYLGTPYVYGGNNPQTGLDC